VRDVLTTMLELVGAALVVAGVAAWSVPAALIVGGLLVVLVGFSLGGAR